ncbi:MAG: hypothetical protein ACE5J5_02995 [Candidatus Hydrothermarchaeales archaeon]
MEEESCWICGSRMLNKAVLGAQRGGWVVIQCKSCFADLIVTSIGEAKNGLRKLPGKDGKGL